MSVIPQKIVGIDFHDYSAELVELKLKGRKMSLEAYNRVLIPSDVIKNGEINKEDDLKPILLDLLNNSNPKPVDAKNVAIVFPPSKVLTHIFTFPASLNENDVKKALPYEAEKIIPFSINDVYWEFTILEKEDAAKKHASQYVFFACITKKIADQYASVLESINLTPFLFGVHAETLKYAMLKQLADARTSLIIDVGAPSVNYLIVKNNVIKYFLSANEGGNKLINDIAESLQLTENSIFDKKEKNKLNTLPDTAQIKEFVEQNYKQAEKIIQEQEKNKLIGNIENIILTGEFLNLPDFYEMAKAHFPNKKVTISDPKINLHIDDEKFMAPKNVEDTSTPYAIYFVNAIGISIRGLMGNSNNGINLLPERLKESFTNKRNFLLIAIATICMTAIALFISAYLFFQYQKMTYERVNLEIKKSAVEKILYGARYQEIRDEINEFNTEINELSNIDREFFSLPIVLNNIENLLPKGVEVSSIDFKDEDLSFEITGIANTRNDLLETQQNFENAKFIKDVFAPISNYDEKLQTSFLIKITLDFSKLAKYGSYKDTK